MVLQELDKKYFLLNTSSKDIGYVQSSDVAKSCDICHEGKSYGRKFRLHLFIKDSFDNAAVKCWNCGYTSNIYGYLKSYHPEAYNLYMKEKQSSSFESLKKEGFTDLNNLPPVPIPIPKKESLDNPFNLILFDPLDFSPIESAPKEFMDRLEFRKITPQKSWKYALEPVMFFNKEIFLKDYLIVPLELKGKWFGFQAIGWKSKRFFVYLAPGNEGYKVWNFFNVNLEEPVYIFESVFDALSSGLPNSIAQLGADLSESVLAKIKHPVFCLDNQRVDDTSFRKTEVLLDKHQCFIWPKGSEKYKDTNDLRKVNIPLDKISKLILSNIKTGLDGKLALKL